MSPGDCPPSFGRFQLLQVVHADGATTLHDAFDPERGHPVALITSPAGADTAEEDRLAFRLCRMRHPNVVSVLDAGRQGDVRFVAAERLQTEPLSAFVARAGRMPLFQGLPLLLQILSAIEHAQARRMVHATIDLEHVQVTPGGQVKLPAGGWSLSTDRQPNLESAARIAHVLLSGACPAPMRRALDEVLLRAEAPDPDSRYRSADEFILALLAAAGYPVSASTPALERTVPAEPALATPGAEAKRSPAQAPARALRRPPKRHRAGRQLAAACLAAALLVPTLIGERILTQRKEGPAFQEASTLGAPAAPVQPPPVALAKVASAPAEPAAVVPSPLAEPPPARSIEHRTSLAPHVRAAPPVARTTVRQRPTPARAPTMTASTRQARPARPALVHTRTARRPTAPTLTAASGCPYDLPIFRDLCEARQCERAELRHTPACERRSAEQRAALARLRGTPD